MNKDAKILKILANCIQKCIKRIVHHNQLDFIPRVQGWLNICKSKNKIYHKYRVTNKNQMIISTDAEKAIDKIHYPCMFKTLEKQARRGTYLYFTKNIYNKLKLISHWMEKNWKHFILNQKQDEDFNSQPLIFSIVLETLARII